MKDLQRPFELACGQTITLQAWGLSVMTEHAGNFYAMLKFLADFMSGQIDLSESSPQAEAQGRMMKRIIRHSLREAEQEDLITVPDLPELLEAIHDLNHLDEYAKKLIDLQHRKLKAQHSRQLEINTSLNQP